MNNIGCYLAQNVAQTCRLAVERKKKCNYFWPTNGKSNVTTLFVLAHFDQMTNVISNKFAVWIAHH